MFSVKPNGFYFVSLTRCYGVIISEQVKKFSAIQKLDHFLHLITLQRYRRKKRQNFDTNL